MKRIFILFLVAMVVLNKGFGQCTYWDLVEGRPKIAGNTFISADAQNTSKDDYTTYYRVRNFAGPVLCNGKYELHLMVDGYLKLFENTVYGTRMIWQFPDKGDAGNSGSALIISERRLDKDGPYGNGGIPGSIDQVVLKDKDGKEKILCGPFKGDGSCYLELTQTGDIIFWVYNGSFFEKKWSSRTSSVETISSSRLPDYEKQGNNLLVNPFFNDETFSTHFATGNITFPGSTVFQNEYPVKFVAKEYILMAPGFNTVISNQGAFTAGILKTRETSQTIAAKTNRPPDLNIQEELPSRFGLFPNPSTGIVNVKLEGANEKIKYIRLYDLSGRQVGVYGAVSSFDISRLSAGTYNYQVVTEKRVYNGKIVKQ